MHGTQCDNYVVLELLDHVSSSQGQLPVVSNEAAITHIDGNLRVTSHLWRAMGRSITCLHDSCRVHVDYSRLQDLPDVWPWRVRVNNKEHTLDTSQPAEHNVCKQKRLVLFALN